MRAHGLTGRVRLNSHFSGIFVTTILAGAAFACVSFHAPPAFALSELQQSDVPPADSPSEVERAPLDDITPSGGEETPDTESKPAPASQPGLPVTPVPDDSDEEEAAPPSDLVRPDVTANEKPPEILYDVSLLPEPVRRMRELIIEACKSGDVEKLKPMVGTGADATQLSLGPLEGDPIAFLRELSGDDQGQEILAILLEVMQSGYVHLNAGESSEIYAWPYFFRRAAGQADATAKGGAVHAGDRRRLRRHEKLRGLHLLPRRHNAGRQVAFFRRGRLNFPFRQPCPPAPALLTSRLHAQDRIVEAGFRIIPELIQSVRSTFVRSLQRTSI